MRNERRYDEIEMLFDAERPGMGKGFAFASIVHDEQHEAPSWVDLGLLSKCGLQEVDEQNGIVCGKEPVPMAQLAGWSAAA